MADPSLWGGQQHKKSTFPKRDLLCVTLWLFCLVFLRINTNATVKWLTHVKGHDHKNVQWSQCSIPLKLCQVVNSKSCLPDNYTVSHRVSQKYMSLHASYSQFHVVQWVKQDNNMFGWGLVTLMLTMPSMCFGSNIHQTAYHYVCCIFQHSNSVYFCFMNILLIWFGYPFGTETNQPTLKYQMGETFKLWPYPENINQ